VLHLARANIAFAGRYALRIAGFIHALRRPVRSASGPASIKRNTDPLFLRQMLDGARHPSAVCLKEQHEMPGNANGTFGQLRFEFGSA
jgi:hypothetical protein